MDRAEYLKWCKDRAIDYLNHNDLNGAVASMMSDMRKHPETEGYPAILDVLGIIEVRNHNREGVRRWITGFN